MKCLICAQYCVGQPNVRILQGHGLLHTDCLRTLQFIRRCFHGLDLTLQTPAELEQLQMMIGAELAARNTRSHI